MDHFFDFVEQGLKFFLFYGHLLSLSMVLVLTAGSTFSSFRSGLNLILAFMGGSLIPLIFGSLGFSFGLLPGHGVFLLGSIAVFAILNFGKKYKTGYSRKSSQSPVNLVGAVFGVLHGMSFYASFMEIDDSFPHGIAQALGFGLGIGLSLVIILVISNILNAFFNAFTRVKKRDWNLILTSVALGLAIGFFL